MAVNHETNIFDFNARNIFVYVKKATLLYKNIQAHVSVSIKYFEYL